MFGSLETRYEVDSGLLGEIGLTRGSECRRPAKHLRHFPVDMTGATLTLRGGRKFVEKGEDILSGGERDFWP